MIINVLQVEEYVDALEDLMIKREDGIKLMPELYSVPCDKVGVTNVLNNGLSIIYCWGGGGVHTQIILLKNVCSSAHRH